MTKLADLFIQNGTSYRLSPTDILFFHSKKPFYCFLEKGEIDLFFLETNDPKILHSQDWKQMDQGIKIRLDFFRTVKQGQLLFSLPFNMEGEIRMVALPSVISEVYYLPQDQLFEFLSSSEECLAEFFIQQQNWLGGFSKIFQKFLQPRALQEIATGIFTFNPEDVFVCRYPHSSEKRDQMLWLELLKGSLEPLGFSSLCLNDKTDVLYPVSKDLWWKSREHSEVKIWDVDAINVQDPRLFSGLEFFYRHSFAMHVKTMQETILKKTEQLALKKTLLRRDLKLAIDRLQTVLNKEEIPIKQQGAGGGLLFDACQIVGNQLNLKFDPSIYIKPSLTLKEKVEELAFNSRIYLRLVELLPNWWKNDVGPFLGFSQNETKPVPLILHGERYQLIDLEQLKSEQVTEENARTLFSHAFEFFRGLPLKEYLFRKDLFHFAIFNKLKTVTGITFVSTLIALLGLLTPFFNSVLFDTIIPTGDKNLLLQLFIGMLLITIGGQCFAMGRQFMVLKLEGILDREFEGAIWQRVLDLPLRFFRRMHIGDMMIRIFSVGEIRKTLSGDVLRGMISSLFSMIYLIPMFYYSAKLAVVGLVIVFLGIAVTFWAVIKNVLIQREMIDLGAKMNNQIIQLLTGITKIRINGAENLVFVLWEKIFYPIKRFQWKAAKVNMIAGMVNFAISNLGMLVIYAVCIFIIHENKSDDINKLGLTTGQFLAFFAAFGPFSSGIGDFSNIFLSIIKLSPLWNKSKELFTTPIEISSGETVIQDLSGNIHLDHLSFRYDENSPYILRDVSIKIKEGEFIGIVGPSGSGKSTLIKLLIGFEKPEKGAIYYDNLDITTIDIRYLRRQIGIVLQTSALIDGTIRDNIATSGFYSDEEIFHALFLAGFEKDLKRLPMGIDTVLMDKGNTLSGGQRQRLIIARALVGKPKILIFDEATSAVDNATQELITENLEKMNVTRIVVAHRMTRIRNADKIYVLNNGGIEDAGTFNELASREGIFATLLAKQKAL